MGEVTPTADREPPPLPRIALVYDAASITPMVLAEAATGICRFVWVVDGSDPVLAPLVRLLRRIGDVVDRSGLGEAEIASAVAAHAPAGILTFAEAQMPLTAALAARLSLNYHSAATAERLADKYLQRLSLHEAGLPGPAVWEAPLRSADGDAYAVALAALAELVTYPAVVKPRRGTSSAATAKANDAWELTQFVTRFGGLEGGLLVEEYLADRVSNGPFADDFAVELLAQEGRVWHLATTGKFSHAPPFRGRGCFLPSDADPTTDAALFAAAEAAVRALGITDGVSNVDVKLTPEGPRVVEVNGRLGGNVDVLIELAGGPSILPLVLRLALGEDMATDPTVERVVDGIWPRIGYFAWVQTPMTATRLLGVHGLDAVAELPHVSSVTRNQRQGDALDWAIGGRSNVCAVFGSVEDQADLAAARDEIDDIISLEFEEVTADSPASMGSEPEVSPQ
jgi:predicted ATP-grasp superfamily ATP-dependent carboligase